MNAKEQAREIWDKVSAWVNAKIGELSFMEQLAIAIEPGKKAALLSEERTYAESIIAAALAEQEAEIARLSGIAKSMLSMIERENFIFDGSGGRWEKLAFTLYSEIVQMSFDLSSLLPPDEPKEVKP